MGFGSIFMADRVFVRERVVASDREREVDNKFQRLPGHDYDKLNFNLNSRHSTRAQAQQQGGGEIPL